MAKAREASSVVLNGLQSATGTGRFRHQALGRHIDPQGLEGYWCDLRHKVTPVDLGIGVAPSAETRQPREWVIPLAQKALGTWERRYSGEPTDDQFLVLAERLMQDRIRESDGLVWRIEVPVPKYGLGPGWASAMGQGQAISVCLRAHALTADVRFLETARGALRPLLRPVDAGGLNRLIGGNLVLEEYPTERPCAVLNGWIFSLFGVYELAVADGHAEASELFEQSVEGLLRLLPRYDADWWSRYSLFDHGWSDYAKPFYQRLHPVMLDALNLAHPDERLSAMADRWRSQLHAAALVRVSVNKLAFRAYRSLGSASVAA